MCLWRSTASPSSPSSPPPSSSSTASSLSSAVAAGTEAAVSKTKLGSPRRLLRKRSAGATAPASATIAPATAPATAPAAPATAADTAPPFSNAVDGPEGGGVGGGEGGGEDGGGGGAGGAGGFGGAGGGGGGGGGGVEQKGGGRGGGVMGRSARKRKHKKMLKNNPYMTMPLHHLPPTIPSTVMLSARAACQSRLTLGLGFGEDDFYFDPVHEVPPLPSATAPAPVGAADPGRGVPPPPPPPPPPKRAISSGGRPAVFREASWI